MVRTQIQLTEIQARVLKRLAMAGNISMAEVIRRSIDQTLTASRTPSVDDRRARALSAVGAFGSGKRDLARRHDEALAEAFE
ncbi:MAG: CopG family transcriptional regulator [Thermoflexales bacterium]